MTAVPEPHQIPRAVPFDKPRSPRVRLRAADADRQATVRRLQDAVARGQLTFDEGGERMSSAWRTRYLADLEPLTADLPAAPMPARPAPPGWAAVAQLALAQLRASLATAFPGGVRSARARLALVATLLGLLALFVLAGATAHALFDGGGPGFGGAWHPHPHFGGP